METVAPEVYRIFGGLLDEKKAETVVGYIEGIRAAAARADQRTEAQATRADVERLEAKTAAGMAAIEAQMATKEALTAIEVRIARGKADTVKWMFVFWVSQTLTILGVLAYFLGRPPGG